MEMISVSVPMVYQHPRVQAAIAKDLAKKLKTIEAIKLTPRARSFLEESLKMSQIQKPRDFNTFGEATLIMVALKVIREEELSKTIVKHTKSYALRNGRGKKKKT